MWLYVGLALVMLLCWVGVPESGAALTSNSGSSANHTSADTLDRHADQAPDVARELCALESETPDEDATSALQAVAPPLGQDLNSDHHAVFLRRVIAADTGHLSISTGLGRGPPVG